MYKVHDDDAELQLGPLPPEERAHLDATPLEELLASFRAQKVIATGVSGYRGVS